MRKMYILDTGIHGQGEHSWVLANDLSTAAEQFGFVSHIFGNIKFRRPENNIPDHCETKPLFRGKTSNFYSLNNSGFVKWSIKGNGKPSFPTGFGETIGRFAGEFRVPSCKSTEQAFNHLRGDFSAFLNEHRPNPDDVILLATTNEFECLALSQAMKATGIRPQSRIVLYFHFGVFPSANSSRLISARVRLRMLQRVLNEALKSMKDLNVRLFATTPGVAKQLNEIALASCDFAPYPVTLIDTQPPVSHGDKERTRLTIAGNARKEQGLNNLKALLNEIASQMPLFPNLDVCVRGSPQDLVGIDELFVKESPTLEKTPNFQTLPQLITFPPSLPADAYEQWLSDSDIGLFLYDREAYRHRASGIFLEMLSRGIPVIVPFATAIADELDTLTRPYFESLFSSSSLYIDELLLQPSTLLPSLPPGTFFIRVTIPKQTNRTLDYARLTDQITKDVREEALSHLFDTTYVFSIRLSSATNPTFLHFGCVDDGSEASITPLVVKVFRHPQCTPLSSVGLKTTSNHNTIRSIQEITTHLDHYKSSAMTSRTVIRKRHSPQNALKIFMLPSTLPQDAD